MRIYIGCDHRGYEAKLIINEYLTNKKYEVVDVGTHSSASCDYPDVAKEVAEGVASDENSRGILICGSGIGISIAANRHKGIRCVMARNKIDAQLGREHNNCNVLALGADFHPDLDIVDQFLNTDFMENERYQRRINKMDQ